MTRPPIVTIPGAWLMGFTHTYLLHNPGATYPDAVRAAVRHWQEQDEMEREDENARKEA